jgi:glycerol-3-phosphate dehydrogenase subunit C
MIGAAVRTTYDPHHPKYVDEADVRDEMTRVFELVHECRLCVDGCGSFPAMFALIDQGRGGCR